MLEYQEIEERFYVDAKTELFYRAFIPSKPSIMLIFVHGADQHSGQFLDMAMHCLQHSIAFFGLDLRGFGQSTGQRGHIYSFDEYLDDLDKFVSFVWRRYPSEPMFVSGHSLGGIIVIRYIEEYKNPLVKGAILSAPALRFRFHIPRIFNLLCHSLSVFTPMRGIQLSKWHGIVSKIYNAYRIEDDGNILSSGIFSARWISELLVNSHRALKRAENFQTPALCLCGTDDPIVDPIAIEEFYNSLGVSDKVYVLFPARHNILQDNTKEAAFNQIVNWVKERV